MVGERNKIRMGTAGALRNPGRPMTGGRILNAALTALLILASANLSPAQSGWQWANPLPQGNDLLGVDAIDANTIIAVGKLGTALLSSNGGFQWRTLDVTTNSDLTLRSAFFLNPSTGWIVGSSGSIFFTGDSGQHWVSRHSPAGSRGLNSVAGAGGNVGFCVGDSGAILRTTDGGIQWTSLVSHTTQDLHGVFFPTRTVGYCVGDFATLLKTTNGGDTWFNAPDSSQLIRDYQSVYFVNRDTGWVAGNAGLVLATTNGGGSWVRQFTGVSTTLARITFVTPTLGLAIGGRVLLQTTNGGTSWISSVLDSVNSLRDMAFADVSNGWIVGDNGEIKYTINQGFNWTRFHDNVTVDLFATAFRDAILGWAVGAQGTVIRTSDGGVSWVKETTPTRNSLLSTFFVSDSKGWAAGDGGTLIGTTDGFTWTQAPVDSPDALNSIYFSDPQNGWVVGERGSILHTTDGGTNWAATRLDTSLTLRSVFFVNNLTGWITSIYGANSDTSAIFKTLDGGANWIQIAKDPRALFQIQFINPDTGWAVGRFHRLIKSTNGGFTWHPEITPFLGTQHFLALDFVDKNAGWVVGSSGTILHTTNGGNDWIVQATTSTRLLYGVSFVDHSHGWIVGSNGCILSTTDGGGLPPSPPAPPPNYDVDHVGQSIPNPFLPTGTHPIALIPFKLKIQSNVTIKVYDALGRLVRTFDAGTFDAGIHDQTNGAPGWDGRDSFGSAVPTGIYFYRVITKEFIETHRLILLR
jgi:photosystem II stability/assembly factor-like uncharacterized protein